MTYDASRIMDLGIIIVSYNVRDLLAACLNSVFASLARSCLDSVVIVVDNASADGSAEMVRTQFTQVQIIASERNLGFAAANNVAMRRLIANPGLERPEANRWKAETRSQAPEAEAAAPRHILLLNPDTEIRGEALALLVRFLDEHPASGAAGAKLLYPDGRLQHSAFRFPGVMQTFFDFFPIHHRLVDSRLNGRYPHAAYASGPFPIDHPLGACLMVRTEVVRQIGLMDEQFFIYCEEIDWCLRMQRAGWRIYCVPQATVVHHAGQSTAQRRDAMSVELWRSRLRLYAKHYGRPRQWTIRQLIRLGVSQKLCQVLAEDRLSPGERDARARSYRDVLHLVQG